MSYRSLVLWIIILGVGAMALRPAVDTDTFWHLRTGEWIVQNRQIPKADPFSSTASGRPWTSPGWMSDVALFAAYRVGGLQGLTVLTAMMVAVALLFVWPLLEGPLLLRAAVLLLAAATSAAYWAARPHIATFALAAFFLWALARRKHPRWRRAIWFLPPAMAAWVNLHGGFAVGFILLVMVMSGVLIEVALAGLVGQAGIRAAWGERRGDVGRLGAVFVLCLGATALNPYGPAILTYPFKTVSIPVLQGRIQEWQSPDFHQANLLPFLAMLGFLPLVLGASRRRAEATEIILAAGWLVLALVAVRNVAVFALAASPVLARHAAASLPPRSAQGSAALPDRLRRWIHAAAAVLLLGLFLIWASIQLSAQRLNDHVASLVPVRAVEAIRSLRPKGNLFNDYNWGGYVLWALYPDYPSFVDGRTDVFPARVFEDYLTLWTAGPGWPAVLEVYEVRTVLLPPQAPLVAALAQIGWHEVYRDGQAAVLTQP